MYITYIYIYTCVFVYVRYQQMEPSVARREGKSLVVTSLPNTCNIQKKHNIYFWEIVSCLRNNFSIVTVMLILYEESQVTLFLHYHLLKLWKFDIVVSSISNWVRAKGPKKIRNKNREWIRRWFRYTGIHSSFG